MGELSSHGERDQACTGKRRYGTQGAAAQAAYALVEAEGLEVKAVAFYRCRFCCYYHVGHNPLDLRLRLLGRPYYRKGKMRYG